MSIHRRSLPRQRPFHAPPRLIAPVSLPNPLTQQFKLLQTHLQKLTSTQANMAGDHDDDLTVERTEGFKVGEKKTLDEYHQLGMCLNS
jgi:hypothetical protein